MNLPRVEVVLSTYAAPQEWLRQQIDSIWEQQGVDVSLLVRDDGSPDDTADRVEALLKGRPARLVRGHNLGPGRSFLSALRLADPSVEYLAFADQDDVWMPDKLRRAVLALSSMPSPALYSARVELVDAELQHLGHHQLHARGHSFANALVQCAATGCTIVMDRAAAALLNREAPQGLVLHDAWAYLVLTGAGSTYYDPTPVVRYRQHQDNVVGVASTWRGRWVGRARRQWFEGHRRMHTTQDRELERCYGRDLSAEAGRLLRQHLQAADAPFLARLRHAVSAAPHRQDGVSDAMYRALFVLRRV